MTDDRSLGRAARSWLEAGPSEAPDRAVEAALRAIQTTRQERDWHVPWRIRLMTQTTRLAAGAAAIAVVLIGGMLLLRPGSSTEVGGPSPSLSIVASPTAVLPVPSLTETFTSASYRYSVRYPTGWTAKGATKAWLAIGTNLWGSGVNDELTGPSARFSGASMALAAGETADQWITAYANGNSTSSWPTVSIGGQAGKIDYDGGPANGGTITPGGVMFDAVVVTGGRAYNFNMDGKVDRATFDAFLASVVLDPSSVAAVPPLTKAFTSTRHGYSIGLPSTWTVTPATAPWPAGAQGASPPDPMLDVFTDPADTSRSVVVVSQPLATGVTSDAWLAAYEVSAPSMPPKCWPAPAQMERVAIDTQPAFVHGGLPDCGFTEAIAFAGGRVYELTAYFPPGGTPLDRTLFNALLATVHFDPSAADDSPVTSSRPS